MGPRLCISLCNKSSRKNKIEMSVHQQHWEHETTQNRWDNKSSCKDCLLFWNSSVLSGWVKKAMVNNLPVVPMHLMSSQAPGVSWWMTLTEDLILHPALWVDGPVDDVKEDVRSRKHNPRVLVYGVGVYPNVHVASGRLHLARNLRVIQCHLGQHSLMAAAILWHPIISCGIHVHRPIASDLGVDHHLIRVADATGTRQLERGGKETNGLKAVGS